MRFRRSIARTFLVVGVVVAASTLVGVLRWQHARLRREAIDSWTRRMESSADGTRSSVKAWLDERQQDDRLLARRAARIHGLFDFSGRRGKVAADIAELITDVAAERGYRGIWLLRSDGSTAGSSLDADSLPVAVRAAAIFAAYSGKSKTIGPIQTREGQLFAVIEPVTDSAGHEKRPRGSVVIGIDPYNALYPMVLREQSGIERARHRLVQHVGSELVVLTPSQFPRAAAGELRVAWKDAPEAGRYAAEGKDTSGLMTGMGAGKVIAATRGIPETGWGIVRALSDTEVFESVEHEFRLEQLLAFSLFVIAVAAWYVAHRNQMRARLLAIAESESRYRLLAEHATDLIMRQNVAGQVLYVSPASKQLLGYDPEELTSVGPLHFVHPDDEDIARHAHEIVFRNPLSLPVQYRLRRADGSFAWFETTGQPVMDQLRREVIEIVTVSRDISKRRKAEDEGRRLATRNALLLESAAEGIVGLDGDGTIIFLNPAGERILGWAAAELLGKSRRAFLHHPDLEGAPHSDESCGPCMTVSTGHGQGSQDEVFWRRDGTSFPVEYHSTPVQEGEGVVGTVLTFRDVGARRRANLELVRAKEEAEAANAAKSEFLARMSHELRTPLNSVIGFSNVLRKNKAGNLTAMDLSYLERIGTNGVQLLALINDILDLSKIEAGKVTIDLSMVEVGSLVDDTLVQLGDRRIKNGVLVTSVVPANMRTIETDATKLRQVLINLIGNAVKFTHAGSVTVTMEADPTTRAPTHIRVSDTGIGIAPDRLSAVFAAFEQADTSTTREYGGTGLGLSISRALCDLLGFRLGVESVIGVGTTFTIELAPASTSSRGTSDDERSKGQLGHAMLGDPDTPLVLVIEDDADARELLRGHVEELGYRVEMAASGVEGLRMAHQLRPHLITIDLMMPGMDGWELLKRLAASPEIAHIPVIIVSSIAGEMQDSFVGAVDWIDKPIAASRLGEAITRNIDQRAGGILIVEDDPDTRELLKRYMSDDYQGNLRVANNGAAALTMLESQLPDLIVLDLKMPYVDGFEFLEKIHVDERLRDLPVIVVTAALLTPEQRTMLLARTIAVLEKGNTLESDLARVLRRIPRAPKLVPHLVGA